MWPRPPDSWPPQPHPPDPLLHLKSHPPSRRLRPRHQHPQPLHPHPQPQPLHTQSLLQPPQQQPCARLALPRTRCPCAKHRSLPRALPARCCPSLTHLPVQTGWQQTLRVNRRTMGNLASSPYRSASSPSPAPVPSRGMSPAQPAGQLTPWCSQRRATSGTKPSSS